MKEDDAIAGVIEDVAGQDVLPLIGVLKGKKNVSEFTLAEQLKEEINTIRNKLYRLYDSNLVEFTRKKDRKKGWYIYYWTFVPSRIPFLMKELKKKKLLKLKERLVTEQNSNFFICSNKCLRLTFDKATDFEFKCPECGSLMNQEDNAAKIQHMIQEIESLEKQMEPVFVQQHVHESLEEIDAVEIKVPKKIVKAQVSKKIVVKKVVKKSK